MPKERSSAIGRALHHARNNPMSISEKLPEQISVLAQPVAAPAPEYLIRNRRRSAKI